MNHLSLTTDIERASGGILSASPEVSDPLKHYSMFNDGGVECEVGEFLYGLVRMLKPANVLETGTHKGVSTLYMSLAMGINNLNGLLTTIEWDERHFAESGRLFERFGLSNIDRRHTDINEFKADRTYGLIFLDTEPQMRFQELLRFYPYLEDGGYILIHDLHSDMCQIDNAEHGFAWPYGKIPREMRRHVQFDRLRPMHFETPRGLTMFYKPKGDTYRWNQ